ncbi:hypothetical protein GCM10022226_18170 [Sphaerisporangium flaviroseum]|uniref:SWIM-type domain-containing protein n=1 Tax=Sphaerisporangium flaviroseum TaxID=509199 RepID=A0ABP7HPZ0_9ACTN
MSSQFFTGILLRRASTDSISPDRLFVLEEPDRPLVLEEPDRPLVLEDPDRLFVLREPAHCSCWGTLIDYPC